MMEDSEGDQVEIEKIERQVQGKKIGQIAR